MPAAQASEELVPTRGELRFEAIYYGVISAFALAVLVARFGLDAPLAGVVLLVAVAATGLAFRLSVGARMPRGDLDPVPRRATIGEGRARRERSQRMMPLIMLLALLVVAAGRVPSALAAAGLCGWALASLAGFVHVRRWERDSGRRALYGGGSNYAG